MRSYKILVAGPFNAGKTTLIRTLCGEALTSDKRLGFSEAIKPTTTVALDFGLFRLGERIVRLFGTPGQERFFFMWRVLAIGMNGYVFMVDSQDPGSLKDAARIYRFFRTSFPQAVHVISANKSDGKYRMSEKVIRDALQPPPSAPIYPTVALRRDSAMMLLESLISLIEKGCTITLK